MINSMDKISSCEKWEKLSLKKLVLGYTCMRFFVLVFCTDQTYMGQIIRFLSLFNFVLEFADSCKILTFGGDSVDAESHSPSTVSAPSETPHWLSQHGVRLHINWVNAKWWNLRNVGAFCIDSVDVESHSALTQLMWSLIPRWLSWWGVVLCVDSVWGITSSGTFKEIGFIKINHKMFKKVNINQKMSKFFLSLEEKN